MSFYQLTRQQACDITSVQPATKEAISTQGFVFDNGRIRMRLIKARWENRQGQRQTVHVRQSQESHFHLKPNQEFFD